MERKFRAYGDLAWSDPELQSPEELRLRIEASNVRHEHEYKVWRDVKLPAGKILVRGVASHPTDIIEHPELVGDRIITFAEMVAQENVIAGTDCGLGGRYPSANRLGQAARRAPNSVSYFEL